MADVTKNFGIMILDMDEKGKLKKIVSMKKDLELLVGAVALEDPTENDPNLYGAKSELTHAYNALCGAEMFISQYLK